MQTIKTILSKEDWIARKMKEWQYPSLEEFNKRLVVKHCDCLAPNCEGWYVIPRLDKEEE